MRPIFLLLLLSGIAACSGSYEPRRERTGSTNAPESKPDSVLDVPGLLTLNIDKLTEEIGPRLPIPAGFVDPMMVPLAKASEQVDSAYLFRYRGLAILASFDHHTRRVNNLLLLGSDEEQLMQQANLQLGMENYLVMPVFKESHSARLLGVRIIDTSTSR
jgi:hypothetical protein